MADSPTDSLSEPSTDLSVALPSDVAFERAGFWRRVAAVVVDLVIVTLLLQVVAFVLYPATGGRVQFAGGFMLLYCDKLDAVPAGFQIPSDFIPTSITDCRQGLFALTSARMLKVIQVSKNGVITATKQIAFLRDVEGRQVADPILDELWLPLFFVLRVLFDRSRGTPGRRLLGVRLADAASRRRPPPLRDVVRRYLLQALPVVPYALLPVLVELSGAQIDLFSSAWWVLVVLPGVCGILGTLLALNKVIYRQDAFYDRPVHTVVLRVDRAGAAVSPGATRPPLLPAITSNEGEFAVADGLNLAAPPTLPGQENYFARHWRGELPLPIAFWVNGVLLSLVLGGGITLLAQVIVQNNSERPVLWLVALIGSWVAIVLLALWQSCGVWRAAVRYDVVGHKFWGGAAKISTVFAVLHLVYSGLFVAAPQIAGVYEIVAGDARLGPHQFRVLLNGQMLEFSGGITLGVAKELENFLNAMSDVKVVRLNSIGGHMDEAQKMADLIKARGLATFVKESCVSACTVVFLGGKERGLSAGGGRLGFHQASFRGMTAADRRTSIEREIARLQSFGLSRGFAERAMKTPPSGMWYPDNDELLREKVVTRLYTAPSKNPASGDRPATSAAPQAPVAESDAAVAVPSVSSTPPASASGSHAFPTPGPSLQLDSGTYQTMRVWMPPAKKSAAKVGEGERGQ